MLPMPLPLLLQQQQQQMGPQMELQAPPVEQVQRMWRR
jgi:hypothetical protein